MKKELRYIKAILLLCFLVSAKSNYGQACNVIAGFLSSQGPNGLVNFTNTSTGTVVGTTYSWSYGDGTFGSSIASPHTYTSNGNYAVLLIADNNYTSTCMDSSVTTVITITNVVNPCSLTAGYVKSQGPNGLVNFTNTSTGTVVGTTYLWVYGDGTSSTGIAPPHTYSANGNYNCYLTADNNYTFVCSDSISSFINVNSYCSLSAGFNHTVGIGGTVNFSNTSIGTNTNTSIYWNFGDGITGAGNSPSHTYISAGAYDVRLVISNGGSCADTILQSVNVTGITCMANSGFSVAPTPTPQYWTATPVYPYNVTSAIWSWGDGSSSNSLYTSHSYSSAGTYSISLTITVSCGGTSSTSTSQYISKSAENMSMIFINIEPPPIFQVGIKTNENENADFSIYPNPNSGEFDIKMTGLNSGSINIGVYNFIGDKVYEIKTETLNGAVIKNLNLNERSNGVYFIKINYADKFMTKKLIISK